MEGSVHLWFNAPFFAALKLLERSILPLQAGHRSTKAGYYALQGVQAIVALSLLLCSLPLGFIGLILHFLFAKKGKESFSIIDSFSFPPEFKMGFADSFFQSCGVGLTLPGKKEKETSDWNVWLQSKFPDGKPRIEDNPDLSQFFINYFDNPQILIDKLLEVGASTYRFSLERSVLEPQEGKFDEAYIQKYRRFMEALKENGIEPFVTLHHFVNPDWFLAKGGFEREENIEGFVRYCEKMCSCFGDLASHWVTINEPAVYCFQAYLKGVYPPGRINLPQAAKVMKHLLIAHCKVYERCKSAHPSLQIGISHNWLIFKAYHLYNPIERLLCYYLSEVTHYAVLRFFQTGTFSLRVPFFANSFYQNSSPCLDFMGVQYYVFPLIKMTGFTIDSVCHEGGKMSSMKARFYPQGMQEVLQEASTLHIPIWITETGCDIDQTEYLKTVFSIMSSFVNKDLPLKGALLWTIRDNLEWERGNNVRIGLHDFHFNKKPVIDEFIRPLYQKQHPRELTSLEI
jgi:beta-glucosidase